MVLTLAACGGDGESDNPTSVEATSSEPAGGSGAGETVAISATEYALDPAEPTAKAGAVTFEVTNDGKIEHELVVEGNGVLEEVEDIEPSASKNLSVDLKAGEYTLLCGLPGHEEQGMVGTLTVE